VGQLDKQLLLYRIGAEVEQAEQPEDEQVSQLLTQAKHVPELL